MEEFVLNVEVNSYQQIDTAFIATIINQFRCKYCNKLLAKANSEGEIAGEIKCPRCGAINER